MAITVKHLKVSTIPDAGDGTLIEPSDWNNDHVLTGTIPVANGGTGAATLTGYVKGNGTANMTAATTIPSTDVTGLGTMAAQNANNVAITGGTIAGVSVSGYVPTTTTITAGTGLAGGGDLSANRTIALANTAVTTGTYGNAARTITQTVDQQGRLTNIFDQPIAIAYTAVSGLGTSATKDAGVANGVATLDGGGTVPISQLPAAVLGALSYQGTWNASTNTPTLTSSVGTKGYYYVVNVAGSTNLNGIIDWQVGDWAVYNGSAWQKIDNTDAVTSVNGYTGTVVLTAADVNAVPYTGATGAVDLNAKSLTNVSNLGVGTTVVPTIKIRAVGDNNSSSRIAMRGYSSDANSSAIRVTKFRGTAGAPQAPQSGDSLGKFELAGYGTTSSEGYPQASLEGVATEAWGAIARGTKAIIKVTPNTTTTQVTAVTINQDSTAVFANTVTANGVLLTGNTGTVTSVAATAGTGIAVTGSPITTSGTLNITNTAPDQTVVLTAGTGISTSGTYPNFTITNTAPSSGGTVTSVTGTAPVVSSGGNTPAISMPAATTSVSGYLTSTDWTTFNAKAAPFTYTTSYIPFGQGTTTPNQSANLTFASNTLNAPQVRSSNGIVVNANSIAASFTIATGDNAMSVGPVTVATGQAVTVSSGSRWVIL